MTAFSCASSRLRAWLQLLRLPNLLTVPGDPLAGFLLAGGAGVLLSSLWAVLASLSLYASGLVWNDVADLRVDQAERPGRPLPSGRIGRLPAIVSAALLMACGALCCAVLGPLSSRIGLALMAMILLYNFGLKRIPVLGPLAMGACRSLSLLLGASAAGSAFIFSPPVLAAAVTLGLYVAAVTQLARHETTPEKTGRLRSLHAGVLVAGFFVFLAFTPPLHAIAWLGFLGAALAALLSSLGAAYRLILHPARMARAAQEGWSSETPSNIREADFAAQIFPPTIGLLISNLLFIQAAFCLAGGGLGPGVALMALWPANRLLCRAFYAS